MTEPDPARARFAALSLVRVGGVALALLGAAVIARHWVEPASLIGGILIAIGAIDVIVVPQILVRHWRTPPAP